ncbi:zona pellucida sperm-binding protein 4-like [Dunckerocampus dactyliophorus]|uniref:zona pellucida sperm-binding protein 4-like n=1 Tax=Dunckerocampus dactyliophorus TaxID=161453 RepID=UPI0024055F83|nr:zona pellucida sperm-binding protein 4-like [Dunckerocampus dactyliophorus]
MWRTWERSGSNLCEAMAKRWSATSLVALTLLWCFSGTKVEAWLQNSSFGQPYNLPMADKKNNQQNPSSQNPHPPSQNPSWQYLPSDDMPGNPDYFLMPPTSYNPPRSKKFQTLQRKLSPDLPRMNTDGVSYGSSMNPKLPPPPSQQNLFSIFPPIAPNLQSPQKPQGILPPRVPQPPVQQNPPGVLAPVGQRPPSQQNPPVVLPPVGSYLLLPKNPSRPPLQKNPSFSPQHGGPSHLLAKKKGVPRGFADQSDQNPQSRRQQNQQTPFQTLVPYDPGMQSCYVADTQRVPCGSHGISAAGCESISCCHDGRQCYFGKSVTVQCTKDGQFIVVVARDATMPRIDLETISMLGDGQDCTHVDSNSAFVIYQFPVTACGTVILEEAGVIVYENRMTSLYEVGVGPLGAITRDSSYDLLFQCRYTGVSVEAMIVELQPAGHPLSVAVLGPIRVELRLANGQCFSKGCVEENVAYSSFYTDGDYPVNKILRDPVYVEVQLMERTDPNLVLTLGRCWTTTSANPHSLPQWDILIDGCPNRDDRYMTTLVPVGPDSGLVFLSHYKRFIFKMFTFVDPSSLVPQKEHVYIHCSTSVCDAAAGYACQPMCFRTKRDLKSILQNKKGSKVVVSSGPLLMNNS